MNFLPYLESNSGLKFLLDTGANKNLIRPGILKNMKKTKQVTIKNITGTHIINRKAKYNFLGNNIPNQKYYEMSFHTFFDGIIGSEFLAKTNAVIEYETKTVRINNVVLPFKKYFPINTKTYNHIVTIPTENNGDWYVPKFTKLTNDVTILPGLYKSQNSRSTILVQSKNQQTPKDIPKFALKVNNFETISPIPIEENKALSKSVIDKLIRTEHLSDYERSKLIEVILKHQDTLLKTGEKLTATTAVKHRITTKDELPVYTKTYRYPQHYKKDVDEQIHEMLECGIIRNSLSPYSSPVWVVPKKVDASGKRKIRVVIDYRKLNEKTIDDKYPIPQIEEILDSLGKSVYFTTLDLKSGFHQIEMNGKDMEKTAFSTGQGHFEFTRMPFGLKNAPATFQRAMNSILAEYIGIICFVYLDDIIIIGYNLENHLDNVSKILKRLSDFNLKVQLDKCEFLKTETEFLGHVITPNGIKTNPDKIKKILEWELPNSQKQIKQFLGLTGYYRRFIKDYSKVTKPLTKYLKKGTEINMNDQEYNESFSKLKKIIASDQVLAYPDFELPFILTTDASNYALGAVLSQKQEGLERPIAFASRTLNNTETKYCTTEKEALAIMWAINKFRPYLVGNKFTLITDHKPLIYIKNSKKNLKLINWSLELENYDYDVAYRPGKTNVVADALSRKIDLNMNEMDDGSTDTIHSADTSEDFFIHFTERPINNYRNQIIFRQTNFNSILTENPFPNFKRIVICSDAYDADKIASTLKEYGSENQTAILAPENLLQLIQEVHREHFSKTKSHFVITQNFVEDVTAIERQDLIVRTEHERAHRGISEMEKHIKRAYFFPKMTNKIRQVVNTCSICAKHKYERKPYNIKISPRPLEKAPFDRVHMDIFGIDKEHYLTLVCAFSKHLQAIEIPSRNLTDIKNALSQYIRIFGAPKKIVCDHEAAFTSLQLKAFLANLGTEIEFASSSESNGQVEKTHSTVIELFNTNKHKFNETKSSEIVAVVTALYNDSVHSATSFTPNEIVFNKRNNVNPEIIAEDAQILYQKVSNHLTKSANNMTKYNNKKEDPPNITENENIHIRKITRKKLDPRFTETKCLKNNERSVGIKRDVKRNKNKLKRIRNH